MKLSASCGNITENWEMTEIQKMIEKRTNSKTKNNWKTGNDWLKHAKMYNHEKFKFKNCTKNDISRTTLKQVCVTL